MVVGRIVDVAVEQRVVVVDALERREEAVDSEIAPRLLERLGQANRGRVAEKRAGAREFAVGFGIGRDEGRRFRLVGVRSQIGPAGGGVHPLGQPAGHLGKQGVNPTSARKSE